MARSLLLPGAVCQLPAQTEPGLQRPMQLQVAAAKIHGMQSECRVDREHRTALLMDDIAPRGTDFGNNAIAVPVIHRALCELPVQINVTNIQDRLPPVVVTLSDGSTSKRIHLTAVIVTIRRQILTKPAVLIKPEVA
jgi:hypothetical protein